MTLGEFFDAFSDAGMSRVLTTVDKETGKGPKNLLDKLLDPDMYNNTPGNTGSSPSTSTA
jgi:hypothetical protein